MQTKLQGILSRSCWLLLSALSWQLTGCSAICVEGSGTVVIQERFTGEFRRIHVDGSMDVLVVRPDELSDVGDRGQISIETDDNLLELYTTEVRGDQLFIDTAKRISCISSTRGVTVRVAPSELVSVSIDGSGSLRSSMLHSGDELRVAIDGSGRVVMSSLQFDRLHAEIDGSGDLEFGGQVRIFDCLVDGSGQMSAVELAAQKASIDIDGSGDVELRIERELNVIIDGSGKVLYHGDPSELNTRVSGSGDVVKKN